MEARRVSLVEVTPACLPFSLLVRTKSLLHNIYTGVPLRGLSVMLISLDTLVFAGESMPHPHKGSALWMLQ